MCKHVRVHTYTHTTWTHMHLHIFLTKERLIEQFFLLLQSSLSDKLWPMLSLHLEIRACSLQSTKPLIGVHCKGPCLLWLLLGLFLEMPHQEIWHRRFHVCVFISLDFGLLRARALQQISILFPMVLSTVPKTHLLTKSPPLPREGKKKAEWQAVLGPALHGQVRVLGVHTIGIPWINTVLEIVLYDFFHTRMPRPVQKSSNPHKCYCPPKALV